MEPMIFRFNCTFCGAHPKPVPLSAYLHRWRVSPESDFDALLDSYQQILATVIKARSRWLTKKFQDAGQKVLNWFGTTEDCHSPNGLIDKKLIALTKCPLCLANGGERPKDRYFTTWTDPCGVQTANFLYEAGIIIFVVVQQLPRWAAPEMLGRIGDLLLLNQKALASVGMLECPFCGRRTTCLYGDGAADNPHRCRWCLDACGGMGVLIRLVIDKDSSLALELLGSSLPKKLGGAIFPWNLKQKKKRRGPAP